MAHRCSTSIDKLAAPPENGRVLIWPVAALESLAQGNRAALAACNATIGGRSISDWRSKTLGSRLRMMTGHQPAFFHAGVWAKNVAAACSEAQAVFLIIDSDQSQGVSLTWPTLRDGLWSLGQTTALPSARALSFEQLPPIPESTCRALWRSIPEQFRHGSVLDAFEGAYVKAPVSDHVSRWTHAMTVAEGRLGIPPICYERLSEHFSLSEPAPNRAAAFVSEIVLNADRFLDCYNSALNAYRKCRGVSGSDHPVPDLIRDQGRLELPFWLMRDAVPRQRMFVAKGSADRIAVFAGSERLFEIDSGLLQDGRSDGLRSAIGKARIRPRALATMMYARLLACDLFIHGIGGAKYDQITDDVIRRYFGIEPPTYACVTATLRLNLSHTGIDAATLSSAQRRIRDVRFNPQRFPDHIASAEALLRREVAITEAQRLRLQEPAARQERRAAYERIRSANATVLRGPEALAKTLRDDFAALQTEEASNRIAQSREWFWCLHDQPSLEKLIASVRRPGQPVANRRGAP